MNTIKPILFLISLFFTSCFQQEPPNENSSLAISKKEFTKCPFEPLSNINEIINTKNGSAAKIQANIIVEGNIKAIFGSLNLGVNQEMYNNLQEKNFSKNLTYSVSKLETHNAIVSLLCGKYQLSQDTNILLSTRQEITNEINQAANEYFSLLLSLAKKQSPNSKLSSSSSNTPSKEINLGIKKGQEKETEKIQLTGQDDNAIGYTIWTLIGKKKYYGSIDTSGNILLEVETVPNSKGIVFFKKENITYKDVYVFHEGNNLYLPK